MITRLLAGWICFCAFVTAAAAADRDWPQWRGPNRDGVADETGLLQRWPKNGPPLAWQTNGLGSGYSSVTIAGERIFTLGNKDGKSYLICLDRKEGKEQWRAEVGRAGNDLGCTPTVDDDRVYAIGQDGDLVCVHVENGEVKWHKHFVKDFGGHCGGWHYTESPLVDGDRLICTPGAKDAILVALDKKTGKVIWKCAAPFGDATAGYSSIVIAEVDGLKMYVQLVAAGVIGVAANDGKFLWHYDKLGNNTANIPTPVVLGNQVFCSAGYGKGGALLTLSVDGDQVKVKEEYFKGELTNKHGGIVVVGGKAFGDTDDSGRPFCADVKTGRILWRKTERSRGDGSAAVTYADGRLYFLYQNGVAVLADPSAGTYTEVSWFTIPGDGPSWSHPVVVAGKLYVRHGDVLRCYDVKKKG
jgi:outer membrane protein assembly factor BamB